MRCQNGWLRVLNWYGCRPVLVPQGPSQQSEQASQAIEAAHKAGIKRQRIELSLPLIGASDLDDVRLNCCFILGPVLLL